jgi:hypothetical protein
VRRALGGDLDWIVMRALEKERERRYDTANGMAVDLERHLDTGRAHLELGRALAAAGRPAEAREA